MGWNLSATKRGPGRKHANGSGGLAGADEGGNGGGWMSGDDDGDGSSVVRIDLEQIAAALRLLRRAELQRIVAGQDNLAAEEPESEARSLLQAILDRHGLELQDFQPRLHAPRP